MYTQLMDEKDLSQKVRELENIIALQKKQLDEYQFLIESTNERLQFFIQQLRHDLQKLRDLQKILVPKQIKKIPGMEFSSRFVPGSKIGGDYYDIFPIKNSQSFGVILSSSGSHGLSSLVLSIMVAVGPRIDSCQDGSALQQATETLINNVRQHMEPQDEWHFFYGVFDKKYLRMDFYSFGNIGIAFQKTDRSAFESNEIQLPCITKESAPSFNQQQIQLDPSGRFILASPGVINIRGATPSENWIHFLNFQLGNGKDVKHIHDLRNHVFRWARKMSGPQPTRDQTVIIAQVTERAIRLAT
ncbi:MAG: hypothetical protein NZ480_07400 [Bdellovibrionaceae bacterium]|nr:hypothetical protein [Pseudobdellovibrionaceae bacterium]MDW8190686.1 hypothetical protein [Pseudobdellovibrionaceae bacterium]